MYTEKKKSFVDEPLTVKIKILTFILGFDNRLSFSVY